MDTLATRGDVRPSAAPASGLTKRQCSALDKKADAIRKALELRTRRTVLRRSGRAIAVRTPRSPRFGRARGRGACRSFTSTTRRSLPRPGSRTCGR